MASALTWVWVVFNDWVYTMVLDTYHMIML